MKSTLFSVCLTLIFAFAGAPKVVIAESGGTTAAGLQKLYQGDMEAMIASAVSAAYQRAKELGSA